MRSIRAVLVLSAMFVAGFIVGEVHRGDAFAQSGSGRKVYELRTYYTHPGKLENLNARFRNHTLKLFEKHGMTNVGYWVPQDEPARSNTLIYVLAHESREAADRSWKAFREDPDWIAVRKASEAGGPIVERVTSVFMDPVDYSALK